jgi:hypothetical protein
VGYYEDAGKVSNNSSIRDWCVGVIKARKGRSSRVDHIHSVRIENLRFVEHLCYPPKENASKKITFETLYNPSQKSQGQYARQHNNHGFLNGDPTQNAHPQRNCNDEYHQESAKHLSSATKKTVSLNTRLKLLAFFPG